MRLIVEHNDKLYEFEEFPRMCNDVNCAFHPCGDDGSKTYQMRSYCPRLSNTKKCGGWKELT